MAYLEGSALDRAELLENLLVFLTANGWTRDGNVAINSLGTKFDFHITQNNNRSQLPSGTVTDHYFQVRVGLEEFGGAAGTWSPYRFSNDFSGPFSATYFFTDGITCAVVVKSSNLRYSHIVFGHLDKYDLYTPNVAFISSQYYEWWWRISDYASDGDSGFNYISSGRHGMGWAGDDSYALILVPDGVVDPLLGFADGMHYASMLNIVRRFAWVSSAWASGSNVGVAYQLDYFTAIQNQATTGGIPLHAIPVVEDAGVLCYLGDMSLFRLVNIIGLSPGQVISFADDDWVVFPVKQLGDLNAQNFGAAPLPITNSGMWGLAFKK